MTTEESKLAQAVDSAVDCQNVPSMTDWLQADLDEGETECRPCVIGINGSWYIEELKEKGLPEVAARLENLEQNGEVEALRLAQEMDSIKEDVDQSVRERLKELDCTVQVNAKDLNLEMEAEDGSGDKE